MDESTPYYVSAVIGAMQGSLEVRTRPFSSDNVEALLEEDPAAIAIAPPGALATERLLDAFNREESRAVLIQQPRSPQHLIARRWLTYTQETLERTPRRILLQSIDSTGLRERVIHVGERTRPEFLAFVREDLSINHAQLNALDRMITEAMKARPPRVRKRRDTLESDNRQALRKAREDMLSQIKHYYSAELAAACDSTNVNPSQFAADLRNSQRVFAVRMGRDWLYPQFQFNPDKHPLEPYPEMKEVLAALAPDKRGWDRLQWFLDPNTALDGNRPLEVWQKDRGSVVRAARTEHWNERD